MRSGGILTTWSAEKKQSFTKELRRSVHVPPRGDFRIKQALTTALESESSAPALIKINVIKLCDEQLNSNRNYSGKYHSLC